MDSLFSGLDLPPRIVTPEPRAYQERSNVVDKSTRKEERRDEERDEEESESAEGEREGEGGFMLHTAEGQLRQWDAQHSVRDATGRAPTRGGKGRVALGLAVGVASVCLTTATGTALVEGLTPQKQRNKTMHFNGGAPSCCVFCGDSGESIVMGFASGHLLLVQDAARKHLNPKMIYSASAVVSVAPVPDSQHLIFAAFASGVVVLLDTRLQEVILGDELPLSPQQPQQQQNGARRAPSLVIPSLATFTQNRASANPRSARTLAQFVKDVTDMAVVSSKLALCGRCGTVLVCSLDMAGGALSINERVSFKTYFGVALRLAWSSNGRLLAVGGEDDMVHVYDALTETVVYRCCGHSSFVTGVCFEEAYSTKDDECFFRLFSVGDDCKLCFFELKLKSANSGSASVLQNGAASEFKCLGSLPKAAVEAVEASAYAVLRRYFRRLQGVVTASSADLDSGKVDNIMAIWDSMRCVVFKESK